MILNLEDLEIISGYEILLLLNNTDKKSYKHFELDLYWSVCQAC
jgi:hypothetical protein